MEAGAKIAITGGIIILGGTIGFLLYKNYRRSHPDDITFKVKNIDPAKKTVDFDFFINGKNKRSNKATWEKWKVSTEGMEAIGTGKNQILITFLPSGIILSSKSLGSSSGGKIINFTNKAVKDFKGDAEETLKAALKVLNNI